VDDVRLAQSGPVPESERTEGVRTELFTGPGLVCGIGFAIELRPKEQMRRFDRMMDFVTYHLSGPQRGATIYEGNAPQDADAIIETGRRFPSVVAIHLDEGGYDKSLTRRVWTKDAVPKACRSAAQP
jgi:hypothetical protein